MHCSPTLTAEEFKTIHNTLWAMEYNGMDAVTGAEKIREALKGAYEQDNNAFELKSDHYEKVQQDLGLSAIWSMFEVEDLGARHPFEGAQTLVYSEHWGVKAMRVPINGLTWAALYVAANAAIRDSGDDHHVFIENFTHNGDELILSTGS